ncbi:MAG TPA: ATP-binding protein [Solirubrobacterales bacterium]|jgi:anti-sigma regulatory factor (Ser/Thr protein kinase)
MRTTVTETATLHTELSLAPLRARRQEFGLDDLHDVRALVAAAATAGGLSASRTNDLVVAASELAANSILYGGGRGLASVWGKDGVVFVEVADAGTISDPTVGRVRPEPTCEHGRGLYIADQLCDEVSIDSSATGTRIRLRMDVAGADGREEL